MERLLLTDKEVCELLAIGRTKLLSLVSQGELNVVRIGRRRLFARDAVQAFVRRLQAEAQATSPTTDGE